MLNGKTNMCVCSQCAVSQFIIRIICTVQGRTFKSLIHDALSKFDFLGQTLIPAYLEPEGREIYEHSLSLCKKKFPGYVEELEGIAEGSEVPFYKVGTQRIRIPMYISK